MFKIVFLLFFFLNPLQFHLNASHVINFTKYMGCFNAFYARDVNSWRDMHHSFKYNYTDNISNTQEKCFDFCQKKNFSYSGLYNGNQCWCSFSYGFYRKADENDCNKACSGNSSQKCGGMLTNSVFDLNPIKTKYIGCFTDGISRDLNGTNFSDLDDLYLDKCFRFCERNKYKYAGLQFSSECFCSNSYGHYGASFNCVMRCSGNSLEICGGGAANSVYELIYNDLLPTSTTKKTTTIKKAFTSTRKIKL